MNNSKLKSIGSASIPRLLLLFSVPAIISMCVNALYNIVDRYFVGQGVGSLGIAGITLSFPISLFIMALSMIIGVGANTLFSIRLGEKKYTQASIVMNNAFILLIVMAVFSFVLGEIFMEPLLRLFGASDQTLPVASAYMRIILCGAVFQTIAPGMNHFIRSMGHPKTAMFREIAGALTNVILDYIFIMKFKWSIEGAAWATVCSQLVSSSLITQFFLKKDTPVKINRRHMKLHAPYVRKIFILGLPPGIMQICNSLMNAILAYSLATYGNKCLSSFMDESSSAVHATFSNCKDITTALTSGGDTAIAAFGIVNSVFSIIVMPLMGFVQGMQPIIGYNYGAKNYNRIRTALKYAFLYSLTFMTLAWAIVQWKAEVFVAPFAPGDLKLQEVAAYAMRTFTFCVFLVPLGMVSGNFFQGTGKPKQSMFLNACRQLILFIPFLLIMPRFFDLQGVFMAQPIADVGSSLLGIIFLIHALKKLPHTDSGT